MIKTYEISTMPELFTVAATLDAAGRDRLVADLRASMDNFAQTKDQFGGGVLLLPLKWRDDGKPGEDDINIRFMKQ